MTAAAATADVAVTSTNVRGSMLPPSVGTPNWQAVIEVGGSQQIVSEGRFYSCHSLEVRQTSHDVLDMPSAALR